VVKESEGVGEREQERKREGAIKEILPEFYVEEGGGVVKETEGGGVECVEEKRDRDGTQREVGR
jgi:hypothetical protein